MELVVVFVSLTLIAGGMALLIYRTKIAELLTSSFRQNEQEYDRHTAKMNTGHKILSWFLFRPQTFYLKYTQVSGIMLLVSLLLIIMGLLTIIGPLNN